MKRKAPRAGRAQNGTASSISADDLVCEVANILHTKEQLSTERARVLAAQLVQWANNYSGWMDRHEMASLRKRFHDALTALESVREDALKAAAEERFGSLFLSEWAGQIEIQIVNLRRWAKLGQRAEDTNHRRTFAADELAHLDWLTWLQETSKPQGGRPVHVPQALVAEGLGLILDLEGIELTTAPDGTLQRIIEQVFAYLGIGSDSPDVRRSVARAVKAC